MRRLSVSNALALEFYLVNGCWSGFEVVSGLNSWSKCCYLKSRGLMGSGVAGVKGSCRVLVRPGCYLVGVESLPLCERVRCDGDVVRLAGVLCSGDWSVVGVFADALEEAGCCDFGWLGLLRSSCGLGFVRFCELFGEAFRLFYQLRDVVSGLEHGVDRVGVGFDVGVECSRLLGLLSLLGFGVSGFGVGVECSVVSVVNFCGSLVLFGSKLFCGSLFSVLSLFYFVHQRAFVRVLFS